MPRSFPDDINDNDVANNDDGDNDDGDIDDEGDENDEAEHAPADGRRHRATQDARRLVHLEDGRGGQDQQELCQLNQ